MSIRRRGRSFMVDVKVAPWDNPTGEIVRVRRTVASEAVATALEPRIRLEVMRTGEWLEASGAETKALLAEPMFRGPTLGNVLHAALHGPGMRWPSPTRMGMTAQAAARAAVAKLGTMTPCAAVTYEGMLSVRDVEVEDEDPGAGSLRMKAFRFLLMFAVREGMLASLPKEPDRRRGPRSRKLRVP